MNEWLIKDSRSPEMVLHPSSEGVLLALTELAGQHRFRNILDLGCGSGLLTLACAQLWPEARILAADISEAAVRDCTENLTTHQLQHRARVVRSDGFRQADIGADAPYDLILCNLLAELLVKLAPEVQRYLTPGGFAVLSGILAWQEAQVVQAYAALGLETAAALQRGEWRTLVVRID